MSAGVTIKHKRKAGAFINGDLAAGEWGLDVTNSLWYFSINGTTVLQLTTSPTIDELDELADVVIGSPADDHLLAYDSGTAKWINQTAAQAGVVATALVGAASGVASLDGGGKVPTGQLPDTVLGSVDYQGTWNATTNTPDLGASSPVKGDYFVVATAGATSLGGITDWKIGDWAIYNGAAWEKVDNTDAISTVFGRTGTVVAAASDYNASQVDNDSGVSGTFVDDALDTLNTGKANTSHNHAAADINSGDLATARMQANVVAAIQAGGGGTLTNASLVLDGGTI